MTEQEFQNILEEQLSKGRYALAFLDWEKWNKEAQRRFGNLRHIIAICGLDNNFVSIIDPSLDAKENPVNTKIEKLYSALNEKQQIIFIGKGTI